MQKMWDLHFWCEIVAFGVPWGWCEISSMMWVTARARTTGRSWAIWNSEEKWGFFDFPSTGGRGLGAGSITWCSSHRAIGYIFEVHGSELPTCRGQENMKKKIDYIVVVDLGTWELLSILLFFISLLSSFQFIQKRVRSGLVPWWQAPTQGDRFIRKMATYGQIRPSVSFVSESRVVRPVKESSGELALLQMGRCFYPTVKAFSIFRSG